MRSRRRSPILLVFAALWASIACRSGEDRAHDIELRILAPCCYRQNLVEHDSEIARTLRLEIARRVDRREASGTIEDDLAHRYGEQVRAMPRDWDPRPLFAIIIAAALGISGLAVWWIGRARSAFGGPSPLPAASTPTTADPAYEDRLDDELLEID